ncbi:hypothetical protein JCM14076_19370 [Methylosoma difficile]
MKTLYKSSVILMLTIASASVYAVDTATPVPAAKQPQDGKSDEQHLRGMQDHMLKMHELSNQILAEQDPTKKEQLKAQQRDMMKEHRMHMMGHRMDKMKHTMEE